MISFLLFSILIIYCLTILSLLLGFYKLPVFYPKKNIVPKTTFSIVVPFRNENHNLPILLESISKLNYPKTLFEVLLIDDDSEDIFEINPEFSFTSTIIPNERKSNSPKKDAITTAVKNANNDWIITTDADCEIPRNWLITFDQFIQKNEVEMVASAVTYKTDFTFLSHFQQLDLMSLQGATIGSFGLKNAFMCNGANFAYTKSFFKTLHGFENNNEIASGDDVFLLQKAVNQRPDKVAYLKSPATIVTTKVENSWHKVFHQRVRWAAKTKSYESNFGKLLGLLVFATNLLAILSLVFFAFRNLSIIELELFWVLKIIVDFLLLFATNRFLERKKMPFWLLSSLFYPFFSVVVAIYSLFGNYEWKGRKFKI